MSNVMQGKVAWVVGGGTGIGQAGAVALAGAGAQVVLSGRRAEALEETAAKIRAGGAETILEPLDVADAAACERTAQAIAARFGRLDILVNSAGINLPERHWNEIDAAKWSAVIDVDLKGAYHLAAACLPIMRDQKDGLIITVSSWAARFDAYVAGVPYNAAKRATLALNTSLNMEEGRNGIRACAICPAEVATPLLTDRPIPVPAEDLARMLRPEDLGALILYVASQPPHVCLNEVLLSPTWNRNYIGDPSFFPPAGQD